MKHPVARPEGKFCAYCGDPQHELVEPAGLGGLRFRACPAIRDAFAVDLPPVASPDDALFRS